MTFDRVSFPCSTFVPRRSTVLVKKDSPGKPTPNRPDPFGLSRHLSLSSSSFSALILQAVCSATSWWFFYFRIMRRIDSWESLTSAKTLARLIKYQNSRSMCRPPRLYTVWIKCIERQKPRFSQILRSLSNLLNVSS